MLAFVLCAVLATQQQSIVPQYFPRLFPQPTGNNGFEEYVLADDLRRELGIESYFSDDDLEQGKTWFELARAQAAGSSRVLALVKQGNAKPVHNPFLDHARLAVEDPAMVGAAGALKIYGTYLFAVGQAQRGVDVSETLSDMGVKLAHAGGFMSYLNGVRFSRYGDLLLYDNLKMAPLSDLQRIAGRGTWDMRVGLVKEVDRDLEYLAKNCDAMRADPEGLARGHFNTFYACSFWDWANLSDGDWQTVRADLLASVARARLVLQRYVDLPFGDVLGDLDSNFPTDEEIDDEAKMDLWELLEFPHRLLVSAVLKNTQQQLLRLHVNIEVHRRLHGRLPISLGELEDKEAAADPLSGTDFIYHVAERRYRLFSSGGATTGAITMRTRLKPMSRELTEPDPPSPSSSSTTSATPPGTP
ncbi:MAG: hypothetical protein IH945_00175 [Armatimonadetes bacterium]|nr:hypothetical protein [Armatimonadota bacterium]